MAKNIKCIVGVGSRLGNFQTACDVIGMTEVPFVSQGADLISGGISLATGDYVGAALSLGGLLPGVGQATGAAKIARRSVKMVGQIQDVAKTAKTTEKAGGLLSVTSKSRGVDLSKANSVSGKTQKSVVNAKTQPKQPAKEKENPVKTTTEQAMDKLNKGVDDIKKATAEVKRKIDIGEAPNSFKGVIDKALKNGSVKDVVSNFEKKLDVVGDSKPLKGALEKVLKEGTNKATQSKYVKQFIKNVENAKPYRYDGIMGKSSNLKI